MIVFHTVHSHLRQRSFASFHCRLLPGVVGKPQPNEFSRMSQTQIACVCFRAMTNAKAQA